MSWYFTCKHVSLFKISLYYMYIFAKFMYNDYIRPYVLLHIVPIIFASDLTGGGSKHANMIVLSHNLLHVSRTGFSF